MCTPTAWSPDASLPPPRREGSSATTLLLADTIEISRLLLQTVVLGFVMMIDELVYTSLAPLHVKKVLADTIPFKIPKVPVWRVILTTTVTIVTLATAVGCILIPQGNLLVDARNAICAGDLDFVYAIDGSGSVAWAYPRSTDHDAPDPEYEWIENSQLPSNYPPQYLNFPSYVLDLVLASNGRPNDLCPAALCYNPNTSIPTPLEEQAPCCLPRQTKVPSISGGKFSLSTKSTENTFEANQMCARYAHLATPAALHVHGTPPAASGRAPRRFVVCLLAQLEPGLQRHDQFCRLLHQPAAGLDGPSYSTSGEPQRLRVWRPLPKPRQAHLPAQRAVHRTEL